MHHYSNNIIYNLRYLLFMNSKQEQFNPSDWFCFVFNQILNKNHMVFIYCFYRKEIVLHIHISQQLEWICIWKGTKDNRSLGNNNHDSLFLTKWKWQKISMKTICKKFIKKKTISIKCSYSIDGITKCTCWMIDSSIKCITTKKK